MTLPHFVVLDLLPLYLEKEVSDETRVLIEDALRSDPELAELVDGAQHLRLPEPDPIQFTEEDEVKAFREAKRLLFQHNLFLILAVAFTFFFAMGTTFLLDDHPIGPIVFAVIAGVFWFAFYHVNRQMSE